MDLQATSPVSLSQLLAIQPEHAAPGPGDIVDVTYGRRYEGGELPLSVRVVTDVAGIATFTVTADAEEVAYSMQAARKALVRASGNDPDKPDSLGAARLAMGPQAFAENVVYLTKQRLMCLAYMRTGIMPFLAANYPVSDAPVEGRDFTFVARFRLRPRSAVEDFTPVCLAFPEKREVTDKDLDGFVGQMMGGTISMDSVPEEAKAGMARLRDQARQECESRRDDEWWGTLMDAVADEFAAKRLVGEPGVRYVTQLAELMANKFAENVERQGRTWDDFMAEPGFDMDEFKAAMMREAQASLRRGLALDAVVAHEGLALTEGEVLESLGGVARGAQAIAAQAMIDNGQLPQVIEIALRTKAANWLAEHAQDAGAE